MSSVQGQFPDTTSHHALYDAIDASTTLQGSADGKVVFLTGASGGIGQATAVAFARAGAKAIYLTARSEDGLRRTVEAVRQVGGETDCASRSCDVTVADAVAEAVEDCVDRFGALDAAVASAGYLDRWRKIGESDPESWWRSWEVNLRGTYHLIRFAMAPLIASAAMHAGAGRSGGHLVLTSSIGGQLLTPTASDYQTAKHALNRLCEFVEVDHGEDGVKAFAIHPGGVATKLSKNMPDDLHGSLVDEPELAAGFTVWLCSGSADWAKGRYLSANWDVEELAGMRTEILARDLFVNRLRA